MNIIFQNENLIVCEKPEGVLSQFDEKKENMVSLLTDITRCDVFPVHRLDKPSSGIMVYAKDNKTACILSEQIRNGDFIKKYLVCVHSKPSKEGIMTDFLFFDKKADKSYVVKKERKGVKKAELEYKTLESAVIENQTYSLVNVLLKTGRTHQIRAQFASRKMPVAGDRRYGAKDNFKSLALFSSQISFKNPVNNEFMHFKILPESSVFQHFKTINDNKI